jgi:hypothetical protein
MADTQRSISALLALLPDNTSGDISPQDVRDIVETLRAGHGEIYVSSSAATSFADTTTWVEAAGTYTLSGNAHNWDENTNARLRYIGTADRVVHIAGSVSMTSSANNQVVEIGIGKNGTILTPSIQRRKIGTGTDVGALALHGFIDVTLNDYLSIMVRDTSWTAAETVTLDLANLFAMSMAL